MITSGDTSPSGRPTLGKPTLSRLALVAESLRNVTATITSHLLTFVVSQDEPLDFPVTAEDLALLSEERTPLALATVLEKALDAEADTGVKRPSTPEARGAGTVGLGEQEDVDRPLPEIKRNGGLILNGSKEFDPEDPSSKQLNITLRNLVRKIRNLEDQPDSESIRYQKQIAAETAANALVCLILKSSPENGLEPTKHPHQLQRRKDVFGVNFIPPKRLTTFLEFCWEAVQDFVLMLLIFLGVLEIIMATALRKYAEKNPYGWVEGVAILAAVCIVVLVTAFIDYGKQRSFVELSKTLNDTNKKPVIRDGQIMSIVDADIVVGDILSVNSHNAANIPADCVLLGPTNDASLKMDEASLTWESKLISKKAGDVILSGTIAAQGNGKMVVIAVGVNSVAGKIKARVYDSEANSADDLEGDTETPLYSKLVELAKQITYAGTAAAVISFLASLILGLVVAKEPPTMILQYIVVAVTVLAVAVPEGLPLAVTLALAFSSNRMTKEQNLVKHLDACETMGCVTTICTDKTGTLTTNKMTARSMYTNGGDFVCPTPLVTLGSLLLDSEKTFAPSLELISMIVHVISIASMNESALKFKEEDGKKIIIGTEGNPTECALLQLVEDLGFHYIDIRDRTRGRSDVGAMAQLLSEGKQFDFSSARKMMSWAVPRQEGGYRIYCKGASEVIFNRCTHVLLNEGKVMLSDEERVAVAKTAEKYAQKGMRCLSLAYRDLPRGTDWDAKSDNITNADGTPANEVETNLVFCSLVGIEDPIRAEVPAAIQNCYEAGIDVRMVTGDHPNTAVSIAFQAGILRDEHFKPVSKGEDQHYVADNLKENVLLEGKVFREKVYRTVEGKKEFDQSSFDKIWPHLRVLARSSPDDKLTLAHGLNQSTLFADKERVQQLAEEGIVIFPDRQVIAMTGDGTNDAPALKRADIGFAMGIAGTQIAKDAADIILLDDNFASIVTAAKWGRNVYASIQKFLQFQLTVNISAVTSAVVGAFSYQTSPLAAIQLLWVNLLMDSLASLALASEPPNPELLKKPPVNRSQHLISKHMWANMLGHAIYQIVVILALFFDGYNWFGLQPGWTTHGPSVHYTIIFNTFVWMQLFNEINCRNLSGEFNVFRGVFRNPLFCGIWLSTSVIQVLIVEYGSLVMSVAPHGSLTGLYWGVCLAFGVGSLLIQQVINVIFLLIEKIDLSRNTHRGAIDRRLLHLNISGRVAKFGKVPK